MSCLWVFFKFINRIWNTGEGSSWKSEKWTVPNGRVAAACFGPDLTLLFVSTEIPETVFSLPLQENIFDLKNIGATNDVKAAMAVIDLKKTILQSDQYEQQSLLGGRVRAMEWDPAGKYLAIIFQVRNIFYSQGIFYTFTVK